MMKWRSSSNPAEEMENLGMSFTLPWTILLVLIFGTVIWMAYAPLDVVSLAQGTVTPAGKVRQVQHLEGGIVREILVKEGETVQAGQSLVILESTASSAEYGELFAHINSLQANRMRYEAEAERREELVIDPDFAREHPDLASKTQELFHARRESMASKMSAQRQEITQREQDISEISARLEKTRSRLHLAREQVEIGNKLMANELSNRYEQIERLKEVVQLESRIGEDEAALRRAKAALEQARTFLERVDREYTLEVQTGLAEARGRLAEFSERLARLKDNLARTVLKAPLHGLVKTLHVVTVGGVVAPGGVVLDLVPVEERLIVEAQLPPQDVGYVQVGQAAFIQLSSMDANRLGKITGHVDYISPDTVVHRDGRTFYLVKVALDRTWFGEEPKRYNLRPGMLVTAGIVTGHRTVLDYILAPYTRDVAFTFTER